MGFKDEGHFLMDNSTHKYYYYYYYILLGLYYVLGSRQGIVIINSIFTNKIAEIEQGSCEDQII